MLNQVPLFMRSDGSGSGMSSPNAKSDGSSTTRTPRKSDESNERGKAQPPAFEGTNYAVLNRTQCHFLESRIDRLAFKCEDTEDAFMDAT